MVEHAVTEAKASKLPAMPADDQNEALLDASKTFKITVIGAVLFCLAALFIILRTRMG
ncbi:MAG: hypothetical protein OEN56_00950 [Gemmatimonadota bacterium]|nr:hypothetical protein [Gemmatimonadota bacterium]MDH3424000.1 hypothetical protein [Gemmatimonadota bacterium]